MLVLWQGRKWESHYGPIQVDEKAGEDMIFSLVGECAFAMLMVGHLRFRQKDGWGSILDKMMACVQGV